MLLLIPAGCSAAAAPPIHPAVGAGPEIAEELRLSFFETFDDGSFRALVERAYRDGDPAAEELLNSVVWNWHPIEMKDMAGRRRLARRQLPPLAAHPDARVRVGIWRLGRYLYNDPETSAAWSSALGPALGDPDPDVRLASIETSLDLHMGWTGGCIVEPKVTAFSLDPHGARLAERLPVEPDVRVRQAILRCLGWGGRRRFLPVLTRYFTDADRREEILADRAPVWALFANPEEGLDPRQPRLPEDSEGTWSRLKAFAASLQGSDAARRNGIVLLLHLAEDRSESLDEDLVFLARVIEWLGREPGIVREEELVLIVLQWRVMDPAKVIHERPGFLRRSNLPEVLKLLQEWLAASQK